MARSTNRQPFILIPRRTNGHWSLACSRVCHQENGLPSNRELALFFVVLAVMRSWNRARCAVTVRRRVPQIGPFFRPMSDVSSVERLFSHRCSDTRKLRARKRSLVFSFPFYLPSGTYTEVTASIASLLQRIDQTTYRDLALTSTGHDTI